MTYECKVKFEGHGWRNILSVQSPTGKTIDLRCNGQWERFSKQLTDLILKLEYPSSQEYTWGTWITVDLDREIMKEILSLV